jgi:hypothetical protein
MVPEGGLANGARARKNGLVDPLVIAFLAAGIGVSIFWALQRRAPAAVAPDASEEVRRELARLVEELKGAVRQQVDRLDREVRRVQEAVAEAERARAALEDARTRLDPKPSAKAAGEKPGNPLHSRVFELRDAGKEPADIGVETGLEVGEVELILGLRRMPPRA